MVLTLLAQLNIPSRCESGWYFGIESVSETDLVGHRHSAMPAGHGNRHELGGLTNATFSLIPNIQAGVAARWPWVQAAAEVQ